MTTDLMAAWLEYLEHSKGRSPATCVKYSGHLRRLGAYLARAGVSLSAASLEQLEQYCGIEAHKEGMQPRSRRALVAAVKSFYRFAHRRGAMAADPSEQLGYPKTGRSLPTPMALQHLEKILMATNLETFAGLRDAAIIATLAGCGLRVSGLVNLNESNLLFLLHEGKEVLILRVIEKGKKERMVPAPDEARLLIRAYLGHEDLAAVDRSLPSGDRVLFISTMNRRFGAHEYHGERRRISARSVHDMLVKYGERIGIPRAELHPHALRHLYGTELAEEDVDLVTRQALLGHEDANTTAIYTHLATRKLIQAMKKANPLGKIKTPVSELVKKLR